MFKSEILVFSSKSIDSRYLAIFTLPNSPLLVKNLCTLIELTSLLSILSKSIFFNFNFSVVKDFNKACLFDIT